eukprot:COSAG01_NODE_1542_length_9973_cov_11.546992_11_plen_219_part_00
MATQMITTSVSGPLHTAPGTALLYDAPRGRRRRQPTQAEKVCICLVALAFLYYSFAGGVAVPGGSTSTLWGCLTNSHGCWESSIKAGRWYSLPDRTVLVNRSDTAKVCACTFGGLVAVFAVGGKLLQRDRDAKNAVYRANDARRASAVEARHAEQLRQTKRERGAAMLVAEQSKAQRGAAQRARLKQEKVLAESHNAAKDAAWAKLQKDHSTCTTLRA